MLRAQLITDSLQGLRISAREEAVVERLIGNPPLRQLPLGPFVTVEADLDWPWSIGADLQERWTKLEILQVEVVVVDGDRLAGCEVKRRPAVRTTDLPRREAACLFLCHPNEDNAILDSPLLAELVGDVILASAVTTPAGLEFDDRDRVGLGEGSDGFDPALRDRTQDRGRRDGLPAVLGHEVNQSAGSHELRLVAVEVEAIDALDLQRYVTAKQLLDVGHGPSLHPNTKTLHGSQRGSIPALQAARRVR